MDADSEFRIAVTPGDEQTRRAWRRSRHIHLATTIVGFVSWLVGVIGGLLWGGSPSLGGLPDDAGFTRGDREPGVHQAQLVLRRTIGWPRDWQVDVAGSFAARWRGSGAFIAGFLWVGDGSLQWAPKQRWKEFGARGFELRMGSIRGLELTRFSRHSVGLIVRGRDGVEVWLWLRREDPARFIDALRAFGRA
jgi:hypothetical protein